MCFREKQAAAVERKRQEMKAKHPELVELSTNYQSKDHPYLYAYTHYSAKEAKKLPAAVPGLVVDGSSAGDVVYIVPGEKRFSSGASKDAEKKRREQERIRQLVQFAQVERLLEFATVNPLEMLRFLAGRLWEKAGSDLSSLVLRRRQLNALKVKHTSGYNQVDKKRPIAEQLAQMDAQQLQGLILEIALGSYNSYSDEAIAAAAAICEVDLGAIEKEVQAQDKAAKKKKEKASKPKKGKTPQVQRAPNPKPSKK